MNASNECPSDWSNSDVPALAKRSNLALNPTQLFCDLSAGPSIQGLAMAPVRSIAAGLARQATLPEAF